LVKFLLWLPLGFLSNPADPLSPLAGLAGCGRFALQSGRSSLFIGNLGLDGCFFGGISSPVRSAGVACWFTRGTFILLIFPSFFFGRLYGDGLSVCCSLFFVPTV
jgi:hypothetical protein